jgi:hypothetical protein
LFGLRRLLGVVREFIVVLVVVVGDVVRVRVVGLGLAPGLALLGYGLLVGGTAGALKWEIRKDK